MNGVVPEGLGLSCPVVLETDQYIDEDYKDTIEAPDIGPKIDDYHYSEFDRNSDNPEGRDAPHSEDDRLTDHEL